MNDEPLVAGGVGTRLLGAAGRVTAGNIVSRVLSFATGIAAARILSEVEFGGFGAVQTAVSMGATISSLALGLAATRYVAKYRSERPDEAADIARLVLIVSFVSVAVAASALFIAAPWIARTVFNEPFLANPLRLSAIYMVGIVGQGVASGVLMGYERFGASAVSSILQNLAIFVGVLSFSPSMRLTGTIVVHAVGFGISSAFILWVLRDVLGGLRPASISRAWRVHRSELVRFCTPHTLAGLLIAPAAWASTVLLARSEPDGLAELGFFTAAQRFYLLILFVSGFLGSVLLPILSSTGHDRAESARAMDYGLIGTGLLVVPLSVAVVFASPLLMRSFGDAYASHWTVLLPMAAWASAEAAGATIGFALIARGHQWFAFLQQAGYALALLTFAFLLRSRGAPGLAAAHLGAIAAVIVVSLPALRKKLDLSARAITAYSLAGVIPLACGLLSLILDGWLRLGVGAIAAGAAGLFYLRLLTPEERNGLYVAAHLRSAP